MRKRIVEKTTRTSQDAVTGELVTVELSPVQLAFERAWGGIERELCRLSNSDGAKLVRWLQQFLAKKLPHTD